MPSILAVKMTSEQSGEALKHSKTMLGEQQENTAGSSVSLVHHFLTMYIFDISVAICIVNDLTIAHAKYTCIHE